MLECCCRKLKKSQKYQRTVGYPSTSWASCKTTRSRSSTSWVDNSVASWRCVLWPFVSVAFCLVAFCLWPFVRWPFVPWPFVCTPLFQTVMMMRLHNKHWHIEHTYPETSSGSLLLTGGAGRKGCETYSRTTDQLVLLVITLLSRFRWLIVVAVTQGTY